MALTIVVYNGSTRSTGFKKMVEFAIENKIRLQFKPALPTGGWQGDTSKLITKEDVQEMDRLMKKNTLSLPEIQSKAALHFNI